MKPAIEAIDLAKSFESNTVLDGASLSIRPGEFVALVGPSGAGKSTLFRCMTGLTAPDAGEVRVAGVPLGGLRARDLARVRRRIGVVFQQYNLVRRLSALDNVLAGRLADAAAWRVALGRFSRSDRLLAAAALDRVGLLDHAHQRASTLSGGQQQRVAIARALAQESSVILADEPVASLDPDSAEMVLTLLKQLTAEKGLAICCTLHQHALAERFCDRILELRGGRIGLQDEAVPSFARAWQSLSPVRVSQNAGTSLSPEGRHRRRVEA
ncbi:phosphonate ABC transporter ATP-binding protein [Lutibaculum baratangense]|uniref:Phosphonate ABC transporter ATP-binding protein n=1 Tax=Lutibaculum baratangense AMV1 TaxID=631454 RepID=V4RER7_9HYPH|nr:phosphonate ABC transporter ATP-binding protein [Lutibaculum baratangense]ESR24636.1 Phosphonate ABC transporter ATP-binding protein [Lutibaculum baratangense AMV1]